MADVCVLKFPTSCQLKLSALNAVFKRWRERWVVLTAWRLRGKINKFKNGGKKISLLSRDKQACAGTMAWSPDMMVEVVCGPGTEVHFALLSGLNLVFV